MQNSEIKNIHGFISNICNNNFSNANKNLNELVIEKVKNRIKKSLDKEDEDKKSSKGNKNDFFKNKRFSNKSKKK